MCIKQFGGGGSERNAQIWEKAESDRLKAEQDAIAEQQRQQMLALEAQRKNNIQSGNTTIDKAFSGFDDGWLARARDSYTGVYNPQVDDQFTQAKDKLTASLAGRGVLESSVGANAFADLEKRRGEERLKVGNDALDFSNNLRNRVDATRNSLYDQSAAAADPSAIARSATGEATALSQQGQLSNPTPLSDIFGSFISPFVSALSASQNSAAGVKSPVRATLASISGNGGSSSIVGR